MCGSNYAITNPSSKSVEEVDDIISKDRKVARGATITEAEIDPSWMKPYAQIAHRSRDDREFRLLRYPYEAKPKFGAFVDGFFERTACPLRRGLEGHQRMGTVMEYETNDIDILQGYRHLQLHPFMHNWFIIPYNGRYYQFIALLFGWSRLLMSFTQCYGSIFSCASSVWLPGGSISRQVTNHPFSLRSSSDYEPLQSRTKKNRSTYGSAWS